LRGINGAGRPLMLRGPRVMCDASRSAPGALSERQRRPAAVLPTAADDRDWWSADAGKHYRELAYWLRGVAAKCRLP
jgi:hypothetical protein